MREPELRNVARVRDGHIDTLLRWLHPQYKFYTRVQFPQDSAGLLVRIIPKCWQTERQPGRRRE